MEQKKKYKKKKQTRKKRGKMEDVTINLPAREKISFSPNGGQPRSFTSEEALRQQILEYFQHQEKCKRPVLWIGIAVWLGLSRETLNKYQSGFYDDNLNKYSDTLREAKGFVENDKLENGLMGFYNSQIVKFDLANNHEYSEKNDINANVNSKSVNIVKEMNTKDPIKMMEAYKKMLEH